MADEPREKHSEDWRNLREKMDYPLSLEEEMEDWLHLQQNGDPKVVDVRRVASDEDGEMDW